MTMTQGTGETDLERVRRIVTEALEGLPVRVYLYGSWAREDPHTLSDIDVAVEPLTALPTGTLARLRHQLEEAPILRKVDLVDLSTSDPVFRRKVHEEGCPWID